MPAFHSLARRLPHGNCCPRFTRREIEALKCPDWAAGRGRRGTAPGDSPGQGTCLQAQPHPPRPQTSLFGRKECLSWCNVSCSGDPGFGRALFLAEGSIFLFVVKGHLLLSRKVGPCARWPSGERTGPLSGQQALVCTAGRSPNDVSSLPGSDVTLVLFASCGPQT